MTRKNIDLYTEEIEKKSLLLGIKKYRKKRRKTSQKESEMTGLNTEFVV